MKMKLITRNTDYAVRALVSMAEKGDSVTSVGELSGELKIPRPFLRKILQILNKRGLLQSYKGKGGGFTLARAPENIFLTELIEIFQGPLRINECFIKKGLCHNVRTCILKGKIDEIERQVIKDLKSITIKSLND